MLKYEARNIYFSELVQIADWKVKIYTISKNIKFEAEQSYANAMAALPNWLKTENSFNATHYNAAFLVMHEASEGVFFILCWWLDGYMMHTDIYITNHGESNFKKISGNGLSPCIWEFEVIDFERKAWIDCVLKKHDAPNFETYFGAKLTKTF